MASTELLLPPRTQGVRFDRSKAAISHTFVANETVGNGACLLISAGLPLLLIAVYCTVASTSLKKKLLPQRPDEISKKLHLWHASSLCLLLSLALAGGLTGALKFVIGNPRPDFLARCQLPSQHASHWFTLDECRQQDQYLLLDGLRSTPSGHSSLATAGLGYLWAWQTRFTRPRPASHLWCPLLALAVMVSRVVDHKHFWYDVLGGCLLGLLSAAIAWRALHEPPPGSQGPPGLPVAIQDLPSRPVQE